MTFCEHSWVVPSQKLCDSSQITNWTKAVLLFFSILRCLMYELSYLVWLSWWHTLFSFSFLRLREFLWIWLKIIFLKMITWQTFPPIVSLHVLWSQMTTSGWCMPANVEIICRAEFKTLKVADSALTAPHKERWENICRSLQYLTMKTKGTSWCYIKSASKYHQHCTRALDMGTFWWIFIKWKDMISQKLLRGDWRGCFFVFQTFCFNF